MSTYYIIAVFLIPGYAGFERSSSIIKPVIALLMMGFYSILMFLFFSIRKEAETRHSAQISALQLSALQSRMEAVRVAEDVIRTERHDLRHRLQAVAELVARGDTATALDFLDAAQKRLDEQKAVRWCRPPVLDAVFSSYFDQAENEEISVDATVALPDELPVNEGELAVVPGQRPGKCHSCQFEIAAEAAEDLLPHGCISLFDAGTFQSLRREGSL